MWIHHTISFFGTIIQTFVDLIGTTFLGLCVAIGFAAATFLVTMFRIRRNHGREAMVRHRNEKVKTFFRVTAVCAVAIYGSIFIWSIGKAVYVDHVNLVSRSTTLRKIVSAEDAHEEVRVQEVKDDLNGKLTALKETCLKTEGANSALTKQTVMQQGSIDNCQNQALHLLEPPALRIETVQYGVSATGPDGKKSTILEVIGLTNKDISPIDATLSCNCDAHLVGGIFLGAAGTYVMPKITPIDEKSYRLQLESPAWTQIRPLGIALAVDASFLNPVCKITRN